MYLSCLSLPGGVLATVLTVSSCYGCMAHDLEHRSSCIVITVVVWLFVVCCFGALALAGGWLASKLALALLLVRGYRLSVSARQQCK